MSPTGSGAGRPWSARGWGRRKESSATFAQLALICAVGLFGPLLSLPRRFRLPVVIGELLVGIVVGRTGFRLLDAHDRVRLARAFYNDAVRDVRWLRGRAVVRVARLAGHAELPRRATFDAAELRPRP